MQGEWKDIPGYNGLYQIAIDNGVRCRSLNYYGFGIPGEITQTPTKRNRLFWGLTKDGEITYRQAACWVAITFPELVENEYFEGAEIDHIDGNPLNNHPSNLRWVTHKENMNNPNTREKIYGRRKSYGRKPNGVVQYSKCTGKIVARYKSAEEAAKSTGLTAATIRNSCRFRAISRGDYFWQYER